MGIPSVKWEKSRDTTKIWGWPLVDDTVGQSQKSPTVSRKFASRSEIPVPSMISSNVLDNVPGVIWNGLVLLSKLVLLWTGQPRAKGGDGGSRRSHARAWAEI